MKAFFKVLISLAVFIFVFLFFFFFSTRYFSIIDSHYYQASVVNSIRGGLEDIIEDFTNWQKDLNEQFKSFSNEDVIKRCMRENQSDGDIALREKNSTTLMLSIPSMQGIRIIEKDTQRIHFSTFSSDIISKSNTLISYAKYGKNPKDIHYDALKDISSNEKPLVDMANNLFIFAKPFYDDYNVQRGDIFFYVSAKSFARKLINERRISVSDDLTLLTDSNFSFIGILVGLPYEDSELLKNEVLNEWISGDVILSQVKGEKESKIPFWVLVTNKNLPYYVGRLCDKDMFIMPFYAKYFLIFTISLASFLVSFIFLNFKQDKFLVAKKKIQKLHASIIEDILKDIDTLGDKDIREKIKYRRHDANLQIRKALGKKTAKKYENEINAILEESWTNIIQLLKTKNNKEKDNASLTKDDEILSLLKEILEQGKNGAFAISSNSNQKVTPLVKSHSDSYVKEEKFEQLDEVEELEEISEAEPLESIETVPQRNVETHGEDIEELEEVESLEPIEELEEISEDGGAKPLESSKLESCATIETHSEDVEELEEIESLEPIEELEEISEAEPLTEGDSEKLEEVNLDDFITVEDDKPEPPKPRNVEVDDYIEVDEDLYSSQKIEAEDRFKDISIGGLDFSYLDEKKEDDASCVSLLSTESVWIEKPLFALQPSPVLGELEVVGEAEPQELLSMEEETIINKDGVYTISGFSNVEPNNMEFKSLVDSVLNGHNDLL